MKQISCRVEALEPFNDAVFKVLLRPNTPFNFKAGQYLCIVMDEQDKRPFSIGSAPNSKLLELHIGAAVSESYPMQVVERLKECLDSGASIDIEAPAGDAYLRSEQKRARLLIAGGTGFSYIKSIVEQQIATQDQTPTTLYWGCRNRDAMYYESIARTWHAQYPWMTFVPIIEESTANWDGKTANLLAQINADFSDLNEFDVYIAGRFDMAAAARELFRNLNIDESHLYGDAFAFIK